MSDPILIVCAGLLIAAFLGLLVWQGRNWGRKPKCVQCGDRLTGEYPSRVSAFGYLCQPNRHIVFANHRTADDPDFIPVPDGWVPPFGNENAVSAADGETDR